jgi:RNA polymerase sigma factor (sigma-70 family)
MGIILMIVVLKIEAGRMQELKQCFRSNVLEVAQDAIQLYARGLFNVESLMDQLLKEWEVQREGDDEPSPKLLRRMAQRICSRVLCAAWRSPDSDVRNCAYDNLRQYLTLLLQRSHYADSLRQQTIALEDVIQQTLELLYCEVLRDPCAGPDDPAAFLKWVQTYMIHQAYGFVEKSVRTPVLSLDENIELIAEQIVDMSSGDPMDHMLRYELRQQLLDAILSLRNPSYQKVLIYTFIVGMDECEIAQVLNVSVQKIYLWRYRALKALQSKSEVIETLHFLLE